MAADHRHLRVVGGKCPPAMVPAAEREMDKRLRAIAKELAEFADVATFDFDDDELFTKLATAAAEVHLARLALEHRKEKKG